MEFNKIYKQDCLIGMQQIPDKSIDMILCDLPYGMTGLKWDSVIPLDKLWEQYERIIKDNGVIALTASQPFTSKLGASNLKKLKYSLIWEKENGTNFLNVKKMPFKVHEDILIFYKGKSTYNPQMKEGTPYRRTHTIEQIVQGGKWARHSGLPVDFDTKNNGTRYPRSVLKFKTEKGLHPSQKPLALFEWLIKTYSNEGETILDNCMGSGTTAIACINTNRNYIGFENDDKHFRTATERVARHLENSSK